MEIDSDNEPFVTGNPARDVIDAVGMDDDWVSTDAEEELLKV